MIVSIKKIDTEELKKVSNSPVENSQPHWATATKGEMACAVITGVLGSLLMLAASVGMIFLPLVAVPLLFVGLVTACSGFHWLMILRNPNSEE
jgi:hypothetical protein